MTDWDNPTTWKRIRRETLSVMSYALRKYKQTGDTFFLEQAKELGIAARQMKNNATME